MQSDGRLPAPARRYTSAWHGLHTIIRDEGVSSLWRGATPNVQRAVVGTSHRHAHMYTITWQVEDVMLFVRTCVWRTFRRMT